MGSQIKPGVPAENGPASAVHAPKLIREAGQRPQGSHTPPVRWAPEVRGEALKSKLKMFGGGG